jgi:hypothetical protein
MNVAKYIFQSPYPSPTQVGRLDPSSKEQSSTSSNTSAKQESPVVAKTFGEILQSDTQSAQQVKPTVSDNSLDTYA